MVRDDKSSSCEVMPPAAARSTPAPATTKPPDDTFDECDFEAGKCHWFSNKDEEEAPFWIRGNGEEFAEQNMDHPDKGQDDSETGK